ncbi:unnamed protein product [Kuraishia capsulata CBS 1993]|uniref:2-dehydropantolactone reductase n=1 Tax=Kuraishia capsulata CBS 1993 TaxID=1382522 RepID=W6MNL4_9ASCO|nr:uncharacterized protein KUCA_T00004203001 [Kuraishia capsulata CBS 1993]CDK28221.1 unnamed protein product [Kuraishia capsulata CBS 1993]
MSPIPKLIQLSSGHAFPTVGLGTWEVPNSATAKVVYEALKTGYRLIDCASLYGNEAECGEGISKWLDEGNSREDVKYTTKLWNSENGYGNAKRAIKRCLEKVKQLGYIDLLLIHSPLEGPKMRLETYKAMQEAVDEGLVKSIGVSNYGIKHIDELLAWDGLKYKPVVNQIEISPWLMRQELADACNERGIEVEAYAPLGHGGKINDPTVTKIAARKNVSGAQVLIRWSMQKKHIPLPKTKTVSRLAGNLDVYSFSLTEEEIRELDHPKAYEPTDWECTDAP